MDAGPSRPDRPYVPRAPLVSQVDADELDAGLAHMLSERVSRALSNFGSHDLAPELDLVLRLVMFRFGVLGAGASPGAALQNLKLASSSGAPSRRRLALYLLLHPPLLPAYALARLGRHALARRWPDLPAADRRHALYAWLLRAETASKACELAGWLAFLWDGRYPSLLMRALELRLVPAQPHLARMVSYEFMNRQLVWSAVTEFILFAAPLLPAAPASLSPAALARPLRSLRALADPAPDYAALPPLARAPPGAARAHAGPLAHLPRATCAVCHRRQARAPASLGAGVDLPGLGAGVDLPGLGAGAGGAGGAAEADDETRVFVPARADCWGRCVYCWYCVHEQLAEFARERAAGRHAEGERWACLRCGGGVGAAARVAGDDEEADGESGEPADGAGEGKSQWTCKQGMEETPAAAATTTI